MGWRERSRFWSLAVPEVELAFDGPMTGRRLAALVHVAIWTLAALGGVAVGIASHTQASGWGWELYKALAQLVVAALGVGFAYTFPARMQAQRDYAELQKDLIALAEEMRCLTEQELSEGALVGPLIRAEERRQRLVASGATSPLIDSIEAASRALRELQRAYARRTAALAIELLTDKPSDAAKAVRADIGQARRTAEGAVQSFAERAAKSPSP